MVPNVAIVIIDTNPNYIAIILSWGEPLNNFNPIVNYTVLCSSSSNQCSRNSYTTRDNSTRSYIDNLAPMTTYTFSVVATNSIGSGEAGVVMITTPGEVSLLYIIMYISIILHSYNVCLSIFTYVFRYIATLQYVCTLSSCWK